MTPRKIVVIGVLVLAVSALGFAVVEVMGPPRNRETLAAHGELIRQRVFGVITPEEADRRRNELPAVGIGGWFLTRRAYDGCRMVIVGSAAAGLILLAAGATRIRRQRSVATPPGS